MIEINYDILCLIVIPHYLIERFEQSSELKKSFNTDSQSDTLYVLRLLGPLYINNNVLILFRLNIIIIYQHTNFLPIILSLLIALIR